MTRLAAIACLLALALASTQALADDGLRAGDAQIFKPSLDHHGIFSVESGRLVQPRQWGFRLLMSSGAEPFSLQLRGSPAGATKPIIDQSLVIHLGAYVGLFSFLQLGADATLVRQWLGSAFGAGDTNGFVANDPLSNTSRWAPEVVAGDARLALKLGLLARRGLHLAAQLVAVVPLGDETVFAGERSWAGEVRLAFSYTGGPVTVAANAGYLLRREQEILEPVDYRSTRTRTVLLEIDDEVTWGVGARFRLHARVGLGLELFGRVPVLAEGPQDLPLELLGGLFFRISRDLTLTAGGGAGLGRYIAHQDIKPLGRSTSWSIFVGARFSPTGKPAAPPMQDTDGDGVPDVRDQCPQKKEDPDKFEDEDGCPDPDNDGDGIPDRRDKCPNQAEDRDGFQDNDGCPDLDNDGDGVPDGRDKCPGKKEDRDGFQDDDGCPDLDNDGDGIPDKQDRCPNEAEDRNGVDDDDGCPESGGTGTGPLRLKGLRIPFGRGRYRLDRSARQRLDRLANQLRNAKSMPLIRVEGHADLGERRARRLSERRAVAVMKYLVTRGVRRKRLQAVGYGATRPRSKTRKDRARNRRVEFVRVFR